jgi:hypothetical protein
MALSDSSKAQIRLYLGYSGKYFQIDSVLEQAMNSVAADPDMQTILETLIARCQDVDAKLQASDNRQKMQSADQGAIVYRGPVELAALRSQGRMAVGRMAAMLGVECRHDAFSPSLSNTAPVLFGGLWGNGRGNTMRMG